MIPTVDNAHVTEGLAMRIGQYLSDPQLEALLTAFLKRIQDAETMLWAVINSTQWTQRGPPAAGTAQGQASGPPDQALLQIADLIGCPAGTLTTWELQFLVGIWLLARKSKGRTEDLLGILRAAFGTGNFNYREVYPLGYEVVVWSAPDLSLIPPLVQALTIARPPAVTATVDVGGWPGATFFLGYPGFTGSGLGYGTAGGYATTDAMGLLATVGA
jgi:hypothetical protein